MYQNNCEINILVKGKPVTEFPHQGQFYIEGREGSEFELEFKNRTPARVMAIFSVDGVSVVDGKEAGADSSGYLVNPNETVRIPGWTLSTGQVAKFFFAGKDASGDKSYVAQSGGDTRNKGAIGVLVYGEKNRPLSRGIVPNMNNRLYTSSAGPFGGGGGGGGFGGGWGGASLTGSLPQNGIVGQSVNNITTSSISKSAPLPRGASAGPGVTTSVPDYSFTTDFADASAAYTPDSAIVTQSLGTGFGDATAFDTTVVNFDRGDLINMMVLYYDDRRGLRARGIEIVRPSRQKYAAQPQAFPGMACKPPPGWTG